MNNIAIIPARGGSKRIPRKNIKNFGNKPMIAWSVEAAFKANIFASVVVSTDDYEIAEIAKSYGAEVPFIRPDELATDMTMTAPVIEHALNFFQHNDIVYENVCCIYPTAPFILSEDIVKGLTLLKKTNAPAVYSVTSFPYPIFRALKMHEDGSVAMFWPENELVRSQDLPEAYHDAGQWYWFPVKRFLQEPRLIPHGAVGHIIPRNRVQDIDTIEDWKVASSMFATLNI